MKGVDMQVCSKGWSCRQGARLLSYTLLLISAIGFLVWNLNLEYQCDDLWYQHYYPGEEDCEISEYGDDFAFCIQPKITNWWQVLKSIGHHYLYWDNGRLSNMIMVVSVMFPKWVSDVCHSLMVLFMMWGLARLSSGRRWAEYPLRLGVISLFVWVGWPWFDMKGSSDHFFNYLWSSALVLYFVILFQQLNQESSRGRIILTSIVGFVAATMHEGISVPFMVGIGGYIVLGWFYGGKLAGVEKPSRGHVISACCFLVGILCITVFCPAFWSRLYWIRSINFFWKQAVIDYIFKLYYVYIVILLPLLLMYIKGPRVIVGMILKDNIFIIAGLAGFCLVVVSGIEIIRSAWVLCIVCTILGVKWLSMLRIHGHHAGLSIIFAIMCCVLLICFFTDLCLTQGRRTEQRRNLISEITKAPVQGIYYVDLDNETSDSWWINHIATRIPDYENFPDFQILYHINQAKYPVFGVLPRRYDGFPIDSLPLMPGDSGLRGVYPYYFTTNMNHKAAHELWYASEFYTAFEFPEGTSPFVKYTPASIGRLLWDPKWDYNKVECLYPCKKYRLQVTQGMREHNFVGEDVDSIIMYIMHRGKPTMTGMRPVRMDIEIPDDVKRRNGIKD